MHFLPALWYQLLPYWATTFPRHSRLIVYRGSALTSVFVFFHCNKIWLVIVTVKMVVFVGCETNIAFYDSTC